MATGFGSAAAAVRGQATMSRSALEIAAILARVALGAVLLFAGLVKASDPVLFGEQIARYAILPAAVVPFAARFFIAVEIGLAIALITGWRPRWTLPAAGALMLVFIIAIGWSWRAGNTGPCGCFGNRGSKGPAEAMFEDFVFLGLAGLGYAGLRRHRGDRGWQTAAAVGGLGLGLVLPVLSSALPLDGLVTDARPGKPFDRIVVEGYAGDIQTGSTLVALIDPLAGDAEQVAASLNALAEREGAPPVLGIIQGTNEDMVAFMFEHAPLFDLGYAPAAALRRFYRRLPVFLYVESGIIRHAWFDRAPAPAELARSRG